MVKRKKPPVSKPPLLSFLLRELSGRVDPEEEKKREALDVPVFFLEKTRSQSFGDMTSLLLSPLLRLARKYYGSEDEEKKVKASQKLFDDDDDEVDDTEADMNDGRFEVLPTKGIEEDYQKRAFSSAKSGIAPPDSGQTRVTGNNYRQVYLEQREQELAAQKDSTVAAKSAPSAPQGPSDKEIASKRLADDQRFRARELQNQIAWWNGQKGLGQYDDATIGSTVDNLQRELSGIPQGLWG